VNPTTSRKNVNHLFHIKRDTTIAASREAIWGVLADPVKLQRSNLAGGEAL
jgi:hypothetical protein